MIKKSILLITYCFVTLFCNSSFAAMPPWHQWVAELREEAVSQGIRPSLFDKLFSNIRPNKKVLRLDKRQPEKRITFNQYQKSRGDVYRIKLGVKYFKKHKKLLNQVGQEYGVSPCFIVSFWGMESSYGNFMGSFPVIKSLATLAYDQRRGKFFRKELLIALHVLNDGHIPISKYKGEWAGASGQPQFLPSSWKRYAVDYNQDGRKDIWSTYGDIFASIANYLVENGWQTGQPWMLTVRVPDGFSGGLLTSKIKKPVYQWQQMGVSSGRNQLTGYSDLESSIIKPYGGPTMMIFNNFRVIMRYNRSTFYAGTIGYMAEKICKKMGMPLHQ